MRSAKEILSHLRDAEKRQEAIEALIQCLQAELTDAMIIEGLNEIISDDGQGYRRQQDKKTVFTPAAYDFIQQAGIEDLFRGKPSISQARVEELLKESKLSQDEYNTLNSLKETNLTGGFVLRRFKPKITQNWAKEDLKRVKEALAEPAAHSEVKTF